MVDAHMEWDGSFTNPPDHHIYPQQFRQEFERAGLDDIDNYTVTLYQFQHDVIHAEGWNRDWNAFFEEARHAGVQPNVQDVHDWADHLRDKYGLQDAVIHPYRDQSGDLGPHMY